MGAKTQVARGRRWLQYSVRTMLGVTAMVALLLGYEAHRVREQRKAIDALVRADEFGRAGQKIVGYGSPGRSWFAPLRWLRSLMGEDWFDHVQFVQLTLPADEDLLPLGKLSGLEVVDIESNCLTDAGLEHLAGLDSLRDLALAAPQVSDAGLKHLKRCRNLRSLSLSDTRVTEKGVEELRGALPGCKISVGFERPSPPAPLPKGEGS